MTAVNDLPAVLVTGGAGYIGSHVCKALAHSGFFPVTYDNLSRGHGHAVKWGPLEIGDIANGPHLSEVIGRYAPVAALHFAAFTEVGESVRDPAPFYANNVLASLSFLETACRCGLARLIFSSSAAVYGVSSDGALRGEDCPCVPANPYGMTKYLMERAIADYGAAYGLKWISLRYFNAAGADSDGETGECHDPETHLVPRILMAAAGRIGALEIFGSDYATEDGSAVRDYVHVGDLAVAHVLALRHLLQGGDSGAFNVGTGQGISVRQMVAAAEEVTGHPVPVLLRGRRAGDPARLVADPARIQRELGFRPVLSDAGNIISTAWAWHRGIWQRG